MISYWQIYKTIWKTGSKNRRVQKSLIFSPSRNEIETMKMATAASSSALFACSKCFSRHPFEELSQGQQLCKVMREKFLSKHQGQFLIFQTCSFLRNVVVHFPWWNAPTVGQNSNRSPNPAPPAFARNVRPMWANMANPPVVSIVTSLRLLSTANATGATTLTGVTDHQRPVISASKSAHLTGKIKRSWMGSWCAGCAHRATKGL